MLTGEQVRLLRHARQIKQNEMARRMGVSQQRYSALEKSRKINGTHLEKILSILNFTVAEVTSIFKHLPPPPDSSWLHGKKIISLHHHTTLWYPQKKENDKKGSPHIIHSFAAACVLVSKHTSGYYCPGKKEQLPCAIIKKRTTAGEPLLPRL